MEIFRTKEVAASDVCKLHVELISILARSRLLCDAFLLEVLALISQD